MWLHHWLRLSFLNECFKQVDAWSDLRDSIVSRVD